MSVQMTTPQSAMYYPESDGKPMAESDTHRELMVNLIGALKFHFRDEPEWYVTGNLLIYYEKGNPKKCIAPDVFIVRGVKKANRRVFLLWEEGQPPAVVFELSSRATWRDDLQTKWQLYAELGVQEYFIFDPEYDYLSEPLIAYRLEEARYVEIAVHAGRVRSEVLELEIVDTGKTLRLFNPKTNRFLPTPDEALDALSAQTPPRSQRKKINKSRKK